MTPVNCGEDGQMAADARGFPPGNDDAAQPGADGPGKGPAGAAGPRPAGARMMVAGGLTAVCARMVKSAPPQGLRREGRTAVAPLPRTAMATAPRTAMARRVAVPLTALLVLTACTATTPGGGVPAGGYVAPGAAAAGPAAPVAGGGLFGRFRNPLAGIGRGAVDPDLRGRIGGGLDTAGRVPGAAASAGAGGIVDPFAGQGVANPTIPPSGPATARAGSAAAASTTAAAGGAGPAAAPTGRPGAGAAAAGTHTVATGETAWSIARRYGVSVADLAAANGLPEAMTVRTGQRLTIPAGGRQTSAVATTTAPGAGSPTPQPPSASKPLPNEQTAPASAPVARPAAPDLGATRTAASGNGKFSMPVAGSIVRTYSKGRNEGIDISAPQGTTVKAAGGGTVAAITRDTQGVPIVVVRHEGSLMTVYSGLDKLSVAKGDKVTAGESIGSAGKAGVLHFEVRQGFESVDPEGYLR